MSCKIYKITCETGAVYYGSTIQTLKARLGSHKTDKSTTCKDFINPKIELVKEVDENDRDEEEAYYIKNFECVNKYIPKKKKSNPIYKIYKITCETGKIYYGYTTQNLKKRLNQHKHSKCKCKDFINPKIELLEICKKEEVKEKEGYYIRNFECVNKCIPGRTHKIAQSEWHIRNKERRNKQARINYINNREERIKKTAEWRLNNLEKRKLYLKKWYLENKKIISQKIKCECGALIQKRDLPKHKRTKRHLDLMEKLTN